MKYPVRKSRDKNLILRTVGNAMEITSKFDVGRRLFVQAMVSVRIVIAYVP
jgi:hypothetical protein